MKGFVWFWCLGWFLLPSLVPGQNALSPFSCPVYWQGQLRTAPFSGGLNAPQFSTADLNNDGIPDLVVFDRAGEVILPYLRLPEGSSWKWELARSYAGYFPRVTSWMLLRDYDGDGVQDLFTFSERAISGFRVWRGRFQNDTLTFDIYPVPGTTNNIFQFPLPNGTKTQIYIAFDDIPAFDDIDGDGDIDLVTFDPGGGNAHWYRNMSIENGHGRDSLQFIWADVCWGKFYETGVSEIISLSPAPDKCQTSFTDEEGAAAGLRHAGSTLLTLDITNNGLKDLILGDISFANLTMLTNSGTPLNAWMTAQDTFWPAYDQPVHMPIFPAAFHVDWDYDGARDILVAPNNIFGSLDTSHVWLYRNEGTDALPDFRLARQDALVGDMLDAGTSSRPAFLDVDGDGLLDMIIGNFGYYTEGANFKPALTLLRNTGTATAPAFTLEDFDFLGMSSFGQNFIFQFSPTAGDLDGDGDVDLVVGHANGTLFFIENLAGPGQPPLFAAPLANYKGISAGSYSAPQIVDVNGDGLMDLLVGANVGNIRYFQNVGAPGQPQFNSNASQAPNVDFFGQVDMRQQAFIAGRAVPFLYRTATGVEMLVGSNAGQVRRYQVQLNDLKSKFPVLDSLYTGYRDGFETTPVLVDLDQDGQYELFVGNLRGGVTAYKTGQEVISTSVAGPLPRLLPLVAWHDPAEGVLHYRISEEPASPKSFALLDIYGRTVSQMVSHDLVGTLPARGLLPGIYFLQVWSEGRMATAKVWVAPM